MNRKRKYKIEKIHHMFYGAYVNIPFMPSGWRIYPITYDGKQYVVEIQLDRATLTAENCNIVGTIYNYSKRKNVFTGHKRKYVFETNANLLETKCGVIFNMKEIEHEDFQAHVQEIIESLFAKYEKWIKGKLEQKEQIQKAENWDGVVCIS